MCSRTARRERVVSAGHAGHANRGALRGYGTASRRATPSGDDETPHHAARCDEAPHHAAR
ncbi:hypothetical protein LRR80_02145 [Streptomyces sp. RO-S4]|nr:hypothetical protein [Streptomyces sp. RO-S4]